ncbi:MAG: hypothetical protein HN353_07165 [Bdellovibrionales bacterium]|nr:hypothetical protein [Bdellovibrionales bacterium]MBT3526589.1 hypothetical protein [Bdellovibrionales bacterium]MBT7768230.1 hypothetical protein [Bdellovibrionales bacterium]
MKIWIYSLSFMLLLVSFVSSSFAKGKHKHFARSDKRCRVEVASKHTDLLELSYWSKGGERKLNRKCLRRHRFNHKAVKKYMGCSVSESDYQGTLDDIATANSANVVVDTTPVDTDLAVEVRSRASRDGTVTRPPVDQDVVTVVTPVGPPRTSKWEAGKIYYQIDPSLAPRNVERVRNAMLEISSETNLSFIPKNSDNSDYLLIVSRGDGCFSKVGKIGGEQELNLGKGCFKSHLILHQLLHAAGLWHEQSRCDRDQYIKIKWDNILTDKVDNFNRRCATLDECQGDLHCVVEEGVQSDLPYDRRSIMHYGKHYFSNHKGKKVLYSTSKKRRQRKVGPKHHLSATDIERVNLAYPLD